MKGNFAIIIIIFFGLGLSQDSLAQNQEVQTKSEQDLVLTDEQNIALFSIAIAIVLGIFLYIARDLILRRKNRYDAGGFDSQKNRDKEKYHSDWTDENFGFDSKKTSEFKEEFRKSFEENKLPNYYKILGLTENASQREIKNRFRKLAKELHPDKSKDSNSKEKMSEINKAYEVLSDREKRNQYDKYFNLS